MVIDVVALTAGTLRRDGFRGSVKHRLMRPLLCLVALATHWNDAFDPIHLPNVPGNDFRKFQ
jgi:hypothetical protein